MHIIRRIIKKIVETNWYYYLRYQTTIRIIKGGRFDVRGDVKIKNCYIYIDSESELYLEDCKLENISIFLTNGGQMIVGKSSILERDENSYRPMYIVNNGKLTIADHVRLQCQKVWIRFGGHISIGEYTNINRGSEIRSDESVDIGSYCQISYNIRIWDTNTHNIYTLEKRREITRNYFPSFGYEFERPRTAPVVISNDVWLGEKVSILKGSYLGQGVIVGYNTIISNRKIPNGKKVIAKSDLLII